MNNYQFPQQKVLCDEKPFSYELLYSLLETVYSVSPPFTGYLKIACDDFFLHFLFFFNGAPYSAGRYVDGKPASYSIKEFGKHLVSSSEKAMSVTLCETDPVLLKNMLLFLQKEPDVKAPTSLIDIESIVRQIEEVGADAMIALYLDKKINFFFFKDGVGALAHYSDIAFELPKGMTVAEEMLLYAFQTGNKVQAFIFRDMETTRADDSNHLDKVSLYKLLSVSNPKNRRKEDADETHLPPGILKNRRRGDPDKSQLPPGVPKNRRKGDTGTSQLPPGVPKNRRRSDADKLQLSSASGVSKNRRKGDPAILPTPAAEWVETLAKYISQQPKIESFVISVESGPLLGKRFTVTLPCKIGRSNCDLILNDRLISRQHAEIKMVEDKLVIEDLASTNGTKVNGNLVTKKQLLPDDLITIGPINLKISPEQPFI
jgi:hypothetical protein